MNPNDHDFSPIETAFWYEAKRQGLVERGLKPQVFASTRYGSYRLDFAFPHLLVGIELDGWLYHHEEPQFTKDRQRQRHLESAGWRIVRFSGKEVTNDAAKCVMETSDLVGQMFATSQESADRFFAHKKERILYALSEIHDYLSFAEEWLPGSPAMNLCRRLGLPPGWHSFNELVAAQLQFAQRSRP